MERRGQEYICPTCTAKKQNQLQPEPHPQTEPELSFPICLTQSSSGEEVEGHDIQQASKVRITFGDLPDSLCSVSFLFLSKNVSCWI